MKLEKNGVTYDLTNPDTIKAFLSSGWVEVEEIEAVEEAEQAETVEEPDAAEEAETVEEKPKRTSKAKAE